MLQLSTQMKAPSIQQAKGILTMNNHSFGIPLDLDRLNEYYAYYTHASTVCREYVQAVTGLADPTNNSMSKWLINKGIRTGFLLTPAGAISLSEDSIESAIATGLYDASTTKVLRMYSKATHYAHIVSQFPEILRLGVDTGEISCDGHRILRVTPVWSAQNTGRLGMSEPGLMNISKELADIETVPKGYIYLTVDSGQIEPRIIQSAYLRDPQLKKCTMMYNDAYYGYVHYCTYLTEVERATGTLDIKPVELSDEVVAKRKKFKTYGNAVMYGSTSNVERDPDKDLFIKHIGGHPNRKTWFNTLQQEVYGGKRVFNTLFGTPIDITNGPSDKNYPDKKSDAYLSHLVRCAINNPIQGLAADLMRFSISEANKLLITKAPKSYILRYTHDSGTFAIHEDDYDKVIDELKGITSYQVDDWIPIYGDPQIGVKPNPDFPRLLV